MLRAMEEARVRNAPLRRNDPVNGSILRIIKLLEKFGYFRPHMNISRLLDQGLYSDSSIGLEAQIDWFARKHLQYLLGALPD